MYFLFGKQPLLPLNLHLSHSKMESKVTTKFRMNNREMFFLRFIGGIDSFHTSIKTKDKEIQIQAET